MTEFCATIKSEIRSLIVKLMYYKDYALKSSIEFPLVEEFCYHTCSEHGDEDEDEDCDYPTIYKLLDPCSRHNIAQNITKIRRALAEIIDTLESIDI